MIFLVLAIFIILFFISYRLSGKDLIHPCVIFCLAYIISTISAIYNINNWDINLGLETCLVLSLGGILFVAVGFLTDYLFKKKIPHPQKSKTTSRKPLIISPWKIIAISIFDIVTLALLIHSVLSIASQFGDYTNYSEAAHIFRSHTSHSIDASLPFYLSQMLKIVEIASYLSLFAIITNFAYRKDGKLATLKKTWYYLLPIVFAVAKDLLRSNRGAILQLIIAGVIIGIIIWYDKNSWQKTIPRRTILKGLGSAVVILVVFFFSATLVGRHLATNNMAEYLTMYAGGSIENLDLYLKDDHKSPVAIPGIETFPFLMQTLYKLHLTPLEKSPTAHLGWKYKNGIMIGNVYTSYRRWLNDFGYIGAILLQSLEAFLVVFVYNLIKVAKKGKYIWRSDLLLLIYAYMFYYFCLHSIDSIFYSNLISVGTFTIVTGLIIGYYILFVIKTNKLSSAKPIAS